MISAGVNSFTYAKEAYMPTPSDRGVIATWERRKLDQPRDIDNSL